MKFTTAAIAATAASMVSAAPQASTQYPKINDGDVFTLMSLRTGTPIQFGTVQAAHSGIYINAPEQGASCGGKAQNFASFKLSNGTLSLHASKPSQDIFVDRSDMGQGLVGYTTGAQAAPKSAQRQGWTINKDSQLVFIDAASGAESGLQACPVTNGGGYAVWLSGVPNPAGAKDCIPFSALALKSDDAALCQYSQV